MAKYRGKVTRNDLEGGVWELHTDDGDRYQLQSTDKGLLVEGQRVEVDGSVDKGAMGIGMTGPHLKVASWAAA